MLSLDSDITSHHSIQNGLSIIAEVNRVIFAEAIAAKAASEVQIPAIARQYIQTVKQVNYQAVGIN